MELIEVEAFIAIVRTGSFTAAAAALHISQPAVSRRLELLERELGAPLFDRLPGGSRLTENGEAFLPFAEQMLAAARDGATAIHALRTGEEGSVVLALVGTLASTELTERLRRFGAAHPKVRLTLRTARSAEVSGLVRQGDAALGIRYFADDSPELVSIPVSSEELVVVSAPRSSHVAGVAMAADQLAGASWVGFPAATSGELFTRLLRQRLLQAGLEQFDIIEVDSLTAQKRLIEADFGIGLLPVSSIQEEIKSGTLQVLQIEDVQTTVPVHVIHRRTGYLGPATRRLLALLSAGASP